MAAEFQSQFQEAMREAEMADLKKQVDELTTEARSFTNFDPAGEVRREFESTQRQIESAMTANPATETSAPAAAGESAAAAPATGVEPAGVSGSGSDAAGPAGAKVQPPSGPGEADAPPGGDKPA